MLAPISGKGEQSHALNTWLNCIHRTRELAETKRVFYVASTRAREELHLFAAPDVNAQGAIRPASQSLLKAAWPVAEPRFAATNIRPAARSGMWARALESEFAATRPTESEPLDLAAAAGTSGSSVVRVPRTFNPTMRFANAAGSRLANAPVEDAAASTRAQFSRPEGSVAARAYGNAVHACLDLLASRMLRGDTPAALFADLATWTKRITGLLRSEGLPRAVVERLTRETRITLEKVLRDPGGLWLLSAHTHAASEFSITSAPANYAPAAAINPHPATYRVDRIFEAGPEPNTSGDDVLWIVDYKTAAPGTAALDSFLTAQRTTYGPQLEAYARAIGPARAKPDEHIRLALYFPSIPRLLWWQPGPTASLYAFASGLP